MTTAYTSLLGLALPVQGELAGTWGDVVNNSITSLLDSAIAGTTNVSTDGDVTLTTTTGAANTAREAILLFSGARTALRTVTAPAQSKTYTVINATTGGYGVKLVGSGPTTGITIANGSTTKVTWNGSDFVEVSRFSALVVLSSYSGYTGGEVLLGPTTADTQSGIATQATGSPILYFDHRATSNTGVFAWRNGSSGANELMRATSSGLGVGTNNPAAKLHVNVNSSSETDVARFQASNGADVQFLDIGVDATNNFVSFDATGSTGGAYIFRTGGTVRFELDSSGRAGLGTQGTTNDRLFDMSFQGAGLDAGSNGFGVVLNPTFPNTITSTIFNLYSGPNLTAGTTVANVYGHYLEAINATGSTVTNRWGLYQAGGSDKNYFAGIVGLGTTTQYSSSQLSVNGSGAFNTGGVDGTYTSFINAVYSGNTAQFASIQHSMSSSASASGFRFLGGGAGGGGTTQQKMMDMTRGAHIFYITDSEVARINGSGQFTVGTTTNYYGEKIGAYNASSYNFTSTRTGTGNEGHFVFQNGNGVVGSIFTNGSTTAYNITSDQRLKENIQDSDSASSLIDGLQVRKFDWKIDGLHQRYGFIAQELLTVAPEAVSQPEKPEQMMSVDYSKLVPMLVKEIQSLRARVAQLESN